MQERNGFISWLADFFVPRSCDICGCRLAADEDIICSACNLKLPRTGQQHTPLDNNVARLFWGKNNVAQCAAFMFYQSHAPAGRLIYKLKYHNRPDIGEALGSMIAREFALDNFFDGIDVIIPLPLSKRRERQRGYNQSMELAKGIARVTGISICKDAVCRIKDTDTQTRKNPAERHENVKDAFKLMRPDAISGKHILLVDDVITTGASLSACVRVVSAAGNVTVSVLTIGATT